MAPKRSKPAEKPARSRSASRGRKTAAAPAAAPATRKSARGGAAAAAVDSLSSTTPEEDTYAQLVTPQGALEHWYAAVARVVTTLAPLFLSVALLCYFHSLIFEEPKAGTKTKSRPTALLGVVYLIIFSLTVAFNIVFGLPAILLGRLLGSLTYGTRITWEVVLLCVTPAVAVGAFYLS